MQRLTMRLRGILIKEVLQIIRDPSSVILALVMPLILLIVFGYGMNLDAEQVPIAVVNDDAGPSSRELIARFVLSENFTVVRAASMAEATALVTAKEVDAILNIQNNFSSRLQSGMPGETAPVQLIVNGIDANRARRIEGYVKSITALWSQMQIREKQLPAPALVSLSEKIWFNEGAESRFFIIPGLITLIMTLIGILLTALVVAREWERGTMETILVTPVRRVDILVGKILPYYLLGMIGMGMAMVAGISIFDVPFRGSIWVLLLLSSLFMLASLGFGLMLSATLRVQFVAAQISIIAGFLPAFFLSGLIFDLESTPMAIQIMSYIVPARYFVSISHTLFMAGDVWPVLLPNALVLAGMAIFFLGRAFHKISKRLEE